MTDKNVHAVALGRRGGQSRAKLPAAELSRIGRMGGRPKLYVIATPESGVSELWRRNDRGGYDVVPKPYDRTARAALYRLRKAARTTEADILADQRHDRFWRQPASEP